MTTHPALPFRLQSANPSRVRLLLALLVFGNVWLTAVGTQRTVYRAGDEIVTITRTKVDPSTVTSPGYSYYTYTAANPQPEIVYYTNAQGITTRQYQTTSGSVVAGNRRIAYDDGTATEGIGIVFTFPTSFIPSAVPSKCFSSFSPFLYPTTSTAS
uniref:Uncharacterized protein n=1 Tax=Anopheles maculatus TaxID=74869 RepID=A0A182S944_9DIPT